MWYVADLGSYDGEVSFPFKEKSHEAALRRMISILRRRFPRRVDLIQLRTSKKKPKTLDAGSVTWDYVNGWR